MQEEFFCLLSEYAEEFVLWIIHTENLEVINTVSTSVMKYYHKSRNSSNKYLHFSYFDH